MANTQEINIDDLDNIEVEEEVKPAITATKGGEGVKKGVKSEVDTLPDSPHKLNLLVKEFPKVEKFIQDTPSNMFDDKTYYKTALTGENQSSIRLHQMLSKYLNTKDPKDKVTFRQNITIAYWDCIKGMAIKMASKDAPLPKRMLIRFGVLLPSLFTPEQKQFFSKIYFNNTFNVPIFYMDEWFCEVAKGRMSPSMTDEKRQAVRASSPEEEAKLEQARLKELHSKTSGKMQSAEAQLTQKEHDRTMLEIELKNRVASLLEHDDIRGLEPHKQTYSEAQAKCLADCMETLRSLSKNNREIEKSLAEFRELRSSVSSVSEKISYSTSDEGLANSSTLGVEFGTVRQMAKMTVGKQGNQYPLFTKEFYHCTPWETGTRETVLDKLRKIESIDPGVFCRTHKNIVNRIPPYVLLLPTYGDRGFCWEPFDRYNRTTSRGRIVVPMYPRNLETAVLVAVADLRWQVAKEKASCYWMEEGLTGQYYQHIDRLKLKGDIKSFFIEDYILWITKEAEGIQRLDKEVRGIFWRFMPFPEEKKQDLRKRSLVYDELCVKDNNRAMSDGY